MIALVLVAHSAEVAAGLSATIAQSAPAVRVFAAAGTDAGTLGTSMPAVFAALERALVDAPEGAVVLLDLNSAVFAVEMALEELEPGPRALIRVSRGPLLEGAIAAALAAAADASLAEVLAASQATPIPGKLPDDWPADGRAPDPPNAAGMSGGAE